MLHHPISDAKKIIDLDLSKSCLGLAFSVNDTGHKTNYNTNDNTSHDRMEKYGKANNLTIIYTAQYPNPEYRIFKTGSLCSRNEEYPKGLVIIDNKGMPRPYQG